MNPESTHTIDIDPWVPKLSKVSNKVLVATGWPFENGITTEIIDLNNPRFSCHDLPPLPYKVAAGAGKRNFENDLL